MEEMTNNNKALVVLSGGQDSTTCLALAKRRYDYVEALTFDYGQKHAIEIECAKRIAEMLEIPHTVMPIHNLLSNSALTEHTDTNKPHELDERLPSSFVPGRNALFMTLASIVAYGKGLENIVIGVCENDYADYPDCRAEFVRSMQNTISLALDKPMRIYAPLLYMKKSEIWRLAKDLEILDIIIQHTHTDYNGEHTTLNEWGYGTLDNTASQLRASGFYHAKQQGWL